MEFLSGVTSRIVIATVSNAPIGVSLVSGFLGSGKTTFVNHLLSADHGVRMGVLVNDFGDIDIDSQLIVSRSDDTVTLANGCICCTLRDDLGEALTALAERDVEHVVVEASGIADPRVLARTLMVLERGKRLALDAVIAVVDTEQIGTYDAASLSLARDQLSQANVVLLNKVDLASDAQLAEAKREVKKYSPRAAVIRCEYAKVPSEFVLGVGRFDADQLQPESASSSPVTSDVSGHGFRRCSFVSDEPLRIDGLRDAATELPANVFRAKGLVYLREQPDHVCVLQVVGRRARIDLAQPWGDQLRQTQIVFLGQGDLDPKRLQAMFTACTKPSPESTMTGRAWSWIRSLYT